MKKQLSVIKTILVIDLILSIIQKKYILKQLIMILKFALLKKMTIKLLEVY